MVKLLKINLGIGTNQISKLKWTKNWINSIKNRIWRVLNWSRKNGFIKRKNLYDIDEFN